MSNDGGFWAYISDLLWGDSSDADVETRETPEADSDPGARRPVPSCGGRIVATPEALEDVIGRLRAPKAVPEAPRAEPSLEEQLRAEISRRQQRRR